jgi:hypothetical protein
MPRLWPILKYFEVLVGSSFQPVFILHAIKSSDQNSLKEGDIPSSDSVASSTTGHPPITPKQPHCHCFRLGGGSFSSVSSYSEHYNLQLEEEGDY